MVSMMPMSRYPPRPRLSPLTATSVIFGMVTTLLERVGSSVTVWMAWMTVSFCMSVPKNRSIPNSKNSHSTPMVMEKQKATRARNAGDRRKVIRWSSLSSITMEDPTAAARKPLRVWSMVSHPGITT